MTDRLSVNFRRDQSLGNENANIDFPTRTTLGADYKLTDSSTLFANQELTQGAQQDTSTSRVGIRRRRGPAARSVPPSRSRPRKTGNGSFPRSASSSPGR